MPSYATGHVRVPNKGHLQDLSYRHHRQTLQGLLTAAPPATWDSRSQGWVGPIKNQESCGSCWDFSGTGVVEIAYYKAGALKPDGSQTLSEEYTLSCGRNGGCNGDDNVTVLQWAKKTGLPLTSEYGPYTGHPDRCTFQNSMTLYKVDDWGFADASGSQGQNVTPIPDIKAAIMAYGCVGAAIAADDALMNTRPGQVFDRTTSRQIDHDIILVGWDDSKGSRGAWLLRNSWGTQWCDQGYCWIGYEVNLVGTESVWAVVKSTAPPIDWGQL